MFLIKIYSPFGTTATDQIQDIIACNIEENLKEFSTMEVKIPMIEGLQEFQRVEFTELENNTETILFKGYIYDLRPSIDDITLICRDGKWLFQKMILYSNKNYSNTMSNVVQDFLDEYNTRGSTAWTFTNLNSETSGLTWAEATNNWASYTQSWDSLTTTITVTKDFNRGSSYFDIMQELAERDDSDWITDYPNVYMGTTIGEDKATGSDIVEAVFNGNDPQENTITLPNLEKYGTVSNAVTGETNGGYNEQSDATSITTFGIRLEEFKNYNNGDLSTQVANYLENSKNSQKVYNIDVIVNSINADLGDLIKLRIEGVNDYLDFEGSIKVVKKETVIENNTKIIKLGLANKLIKIDNFTRKINDIQSKIRFLNTK